MTTVSTFQKEAPEDQIPQSPLRRQLFHIIFEAETPGGRIFDMALLWAILLSVAVVILESVAEFRQQYGSLFYFFEWFFTVLFTIEYSLRLFCVRHPLRYARSFFGIIDLLSILPTYLSLVIPGAQTLLVIRAVRLLRVFRLFKLARYTGEARVLVTAISGALPKITVFLGAVLTLVLVMGSLMYLIEGEAGGFDNIPRGIYWAIVTLTTVGYGDITPNTPLGQFLAAVVMIMGYGIIAVPTGIVSAEFTQARRDHANTRTCDACHLEGHDVQAGYCRRCGQSLRPSP